MQKIIFEVRGLKGDGHLDKAEKHHNDTVKRQPGAAGSWLFLSACALEREDHERAAYALRQYLKIDHISADAWHWLGTSLINQEDLAGAQSAFEEAIKIQPENKISILYLGRAAEKVGNNPLALDCYSIALRSPDAAEIEEGADTNAAVRQTSAAAADFLSHYAANDQDMSADKSLAFLGVSWNEAVKANQFYFQAEKVLAACNPDLQAKRAQSAFAKVLAHNKQHKKALYRLADLAFGEGSDEKGLDFLRRFAALSLSHAATQYRLAAIEEQIGTPQNAKSAYLLSLKADPNNILTYLYAGFFFEKRVAANGPDMEIAAQLYSLGMDLNKALPKLHQNTKINDETRRRSYAAFLLLDKKFTDLHQQAATPTGGRILEAVWPQTSAENVVYREPNQRPHEFYIPGLEPIRFLGRAQMPWAAEVEAAFGDIKAELTAAMKAESVERRPYLDANMQLGAEFEPILGTMNWTALDLYRDGIAANDIEQKFPKTIKALKAAPLTTFGECPFEVFFSLLKPHQHIPPHFGLSNHGVTVHLPITIPPNCKIRVDKEWRKWEEGQLIAFDDSFDHEARNDSDEMRVVLIFEVWHPDLTEAEKAAICRSFNARNDWLQSRQVPGLEKAGL